jgi:hypothetical protein
MTSPFFPDPLQIWREALTRLESDINSLATGSLKSQEVVRSLHQFSSVSLGMQQMLETLFDNYLRKANLPTRKQVAELAESLIRIELKLDRLSPPDETSESPRPARTRRPPSSTPATTEEAASTATPSTKRTPRGKRTDKE